MNQDKQADSKLELVSCCTCGYEWPDGTNGTHSCVQIMSRTIDQQADEIKRLRAQLMKDIQVTAKMVSAGEAAWAAKERDMYSPTPTEFPGGGPAEACFFAMISEYNKLLTGSLPSN